MKLNDPKGAAGALKTPLGLIPAYSMDQTAWVHKHGSDKYGPYNWRDTGVCASTYINAIMRHLNAWRDGEDIDPESGITHLAHIACSCNILMDASNCNMLQDDRNITPENIQSEEYYELDGDDTIKEGDEYYDPYQCEWVKSGYTGMPIEYSNLSYRRPIEKSVDEISVCECGRYKIDHFDLGLICEDCETNWQDLS